MKSAKGESAECVQSPSPTSAECTFHQNEITVISNILPFKANFYQVCRISPLKNTKIVSQVVITGSHKVARGKILILWRS